MMRWSYVTHPRRAVIPALALLAAAGPLAFGQRGSLREGAVGSVVPGDGPEPGHRQRPEGREGYVETGDGTRLHYRILGEGTPTVVVPVGFYVADALAPLAEGRRVVFYDPRGRGRSDAVDPSNVSLDHQLRDLETLRSALGIDRMALIGWSGLGMEMAVYALRHPDRVTRIVQMAPVAPRRDPHMGQMIENRQARVDEEAQRRFDARVEAGEFEGREAALCRARTALTAHVNLADSADVEALPDVCDLPNEWGSNLGPYFEALLGSFGAYDWRDRLAELDGIPRLVIHGAADPVSLEGTLEWVRGRPNARLIVVEEAGHWPFIESPERVLTAIDTFLEGSWPAEAQRAPDGRSPEGALDRQRDIRALLGLHAEVMEAHRQRDVDRLLATVSDDAVVVSRGSVRHPTPVEMRRRFSDYLGRTRFTEYRDLIEPIVRVSDDGTLGWVIVRVRARGLQRTEAGEAGPLEFVSAWIELYEKREAGWIGVGNVSNFAP